MFSVHVILFVQREQVNLICYVCVILVALWEFRIIRLWGRLLVSGGFTEKKRRKKQGDESKFIECAQSNNNL